MVPMRVKCPKCGATAAVRLTGETSYEMKHDKAVAVVCPEVDQKLRAAPDGRTRVSCGTLDAEVDRVVAAFIARR